MTKRKGIPARAFMANFSSAGRAIAGPKICVNCKTQPARRDSIYCSDRCRNAFLTFPEEPARFNVVERWDGEKWVEIQLEWNGTEYKEIK